MTTSLPRVRRTLRELVLTLGAVVGAVCLLLAAAVLVLDLRVLSFRSGSMAPTMPTGSLALARSVPAAELSQGDVVSVTTSAGSRVTHRIVEIQHLGDRASLELRGDANQVSDAAPYLVGEADRVFFSVPFLGYAGALLTAPLGLFLLGLYAAYLGRVLLRRRQATNAVVVALVLGLAAASATVAYRSSTTLAAWTDAAGTTGSRFATGSVAAPATFTCGALGVLSVTFNWSAVPGATSYTLHYGPGGALTRTVTGTSTTVITVISGGSAWVRANKDYGSTTWTSPNSTTRSYTVAVVSLCG